MELRDVDIRPGKVLQVVDNYGTIKASCAGVFSEEDDPEMLPPIIPFFNVSPTSFCKPHQGDNINVWINTQNPQELYYTFQGNVKHNNESELMYGNEDVEIVSRHKFPADEANNEPSSDSAIVYAEESGWRMSDRETGIVVSNDGGVEIQQGNGMHSINVTEEGINLSNNKSNRLEPAVLGDELERLLNDIMDLFNSIANICDKNPHTMAIKSAIELKAPQISKRINKIKSNTVKLT